MKTRSRVKRGRNEIYVRLDFGAGCGACSRGFFSQTHVLYLQVSLSPFYAVITRTIVTKITSRPTKVLYSFVSAIVFPF